MAHICLLVACTEVIRQEVTLQDLFKYNTIAASGTTLLVVGVQHCYWWCGMPQWGSFKFKYNTVVGVTTVGQPHIQHCCTVGQPQVQLGQPQVQLGQPQVQLGQPQVQLGQLKYNTVVQWGRSGKTMEQHVTIGITRYD